MLSSRAASSEPARLSVAFLQMMACTHLASHLWLADVGLGCFAALLEVVTRLRVAPWICKTRGCLTFYLRVRLMAIVKALSLNSSVLMAVESSDVEEELIPHGGT